MLWGGGRLDLQSQRATFRRVGKETQKANFLTKTTCKIQPINYHSLSNILVPVNSPNHIITKFKNCFQINPDKR